MRLVVIERGEEGSEHIVELVHESLIDRWPALARWLSENQDDAAFRARLRAAALEWERRDRDAGLLWRDAPAREAQLWYAHYRGTLTRREQDYLEAVFDLSSSAVRVRRRIVAGIMALMALLLVGAGVALLQIRQAQRETDRQADVARARAVEAEQARDNAEIAKQEARKAQDEAESERDQANRARASEANARQAEQAAFEIAEAKRREAENQRAAAERQKKEAERQKAIAEQEEAHAREQEELAKRANETLQALLRERELRIDELEQQLKGGLIKRLPAPGIGGDRSAQPKLTPQVRTNQKPGRE
jgi:pyruvate/2-oxoglutarate dehydrogenase complex dihydrolipoamide acyltransferase (E2) component